MLETTLLAAWEGLGLVFSWPNVLYPLAGTMLAMTVAFLPGVSGGSIVVAGIESDVLWVFDNDPVAILQVQGKRPKRGLSQETLNFRPHHGCSHHRHRSRA
jgi:hypothetical protein